MTKLTRWVAIIVVASAALLVADEKDEHSRSVFQIVERVDDGRVVSIKSVYKRETGELVLHGPYFFFHENGRRRVEIHYRDGLRHGPNYHWADNGEMVLKGFYRNDEREGTWTTFHSDGTLSTRCKYSKGHIDGSELYFGIDGKAVVREDRYDPMSHRLTEQIRWHKNGKMAMRGSFKPCPPVAKEPLTNAVSEMADPDNPTPAELERLGRVLNQLAKQSVDIREGVWTYWDVDGKVLAKGVWKNDKPLHGVCAVRPESFDSVLPPRYFARYKDGNEVERLPDLGVVFD